MEAFGMFAICWVILSFIFHFIPKAQKYICPKCFTFWLVLLIEIICYHFQIKDINPFSAALASFFMMLKEKYINEKEITL
jgi:hypothetical protein